MPGGAKNTEAPSKQASSYSTGPTPDNGNLHNTSKSNDNNNNSDIKQSKRYSRSENGKNFSNNLNGQKNKSPSRNQYKNQHKDQQQYHEQVAPINSERRRGKVKFFNSQKGYGFLIPDDPNEININGLNESMCVCIWMFG